MRPRQEKKIEHVKKLLKKPRSVKELVQKTGSSERSIYRWISQMNGSVVRVPGRRGIFVLGAR